MENQHLKNRNFRKNIENVQGNSLRIKIPSKSCTKVISNQEFYPQPKDQYSTRTKQRTVFLDIPTLGCRTVGCQMWQHYPCVALSWQKGQDCFWAVRKSGCFLWPICLCPEALLTADQRFPPPGISRPHLKRAAVLLWSRGQRFLGKGPGSRHRHGRSHTLFSSGYKAWWTSVNSTTVELRGKKAVWRKILPYSSQRHLETWKENVSTWSYIQHSLHKHFLGTPRCSTCICKKHNFVFVKKIVFVFLKSQRILK